jgi:hypothetical protein
VLEQGEEAENQPQTRRIPRFLMKKAGLFSPASHSSV